LQAPHINRAGFVDVLSYIADTPIPWNWGWG